MLQHLLNGRACRPLRRLYSNESHHRTYDIIIAGGGMVGAAMAASLSVSPYFQNKSVLMLEAGVSKIASSTLDSNRPYSNRVSAINPGTRRLFESFGVWQRLEKTNRFKPVQQLQVWDACSQSKIHFEKQNFDSAVAYIIENELIVDCCMEHLRDNASNNVEIRTNSLVERANLTRDLSQLVDVELADGSKLKTSLLIGADGANSSVRQIMGVNIVAWPYNQKALVATLEVSTTGNNDIAWQRFMPDGPVALLPLTNKLSSLVWTTTPSEADRLLTLPDDQFVDSLNSSLHDDTLQDTITNKSLEFLNNCLNILAPAVPTDAHLISPTVVRVLEKSRACFPLGLSHATHYVQPRTVLIGDAAHRVHPLAGQGVNLGFGDVSVLTGVLEEAIREGADFGSMLYLSKYESQRQRHNVPVMFTIDWLNRLYATRTFPFVLARSIGLQTVDRMEWLKKLIINEASI